MVQRGVLIACVVIGLAGPGVAVADATSEAVGRVAEATDGAMAMVQYTYGEGRERRSQAGPGFCIDAGKGIFLTMAIPQQADPNQLANLQLMVPGNERKTVPAELLGVDPVTGLGFVQATGDHGFSAVRFAAKGEVATGDLVISAGIMPGDPANSPYYGVGYASTTLYVPEPIVRVTGGNLTTTGSLVLRSDGRTVGIVAEQPFGSYQARTQQGVTTMSMRNVQATQYFTPVDEFRPVLQDIPTDGKIPRRGWIGAGFRAVPDEVNVYDQPIVKITSMIEGQSADRAGLQEEDVVFAINGEPIPDLATPSLERARAMQLVSRVPVGQQATLTVARGNERREISVPVTPMPTTASEARRFISRRLQLVLREKVLLDTYTGDQALADVDGLLVAQAPESGPAGQAGLQRGDLVTHMGRTEVTSVQQAQQAVQNAAQALRFVVRRGDQEEVITVNLPSPQQQ